MKKEKKNYYPPQMEVIELREKPVLLVGSDGNLPPNPNIPI
jgi:hypothetical protein